MRITFVLPTVSMSGGIRVVAIHAKELAARGHVVTIVSPPPHAPTLRGKVRALLEGRGWPGSPAPAKSHLDGSGLDHRVLNRWRAVTDDDVPDADVVVATWWETAEWIAALSPRKGAKAYFIQGHEIFPYLPLERVRATYRLPLHKIVIAKWLRDAMLEYGDSEVNLVPNSIDHGQFHAAPRGRQARPTLGFLYSRAAFKGTDVALAAIRQLRAVLPDLRVISFGALVPDHPIEEGIEFHHSPPQDRLRDLYAQCDVWVTASRSEGFNLPAMEAMACRTPVVATRTGWPAEAIETGRNGALVEPGDAVALAAAAQWILTLAEPEWKVLSSRAHDTVAASSWRASTDKFEQALLNACRRSAATGRARREGVLLHG